MTKGVGTGSGATTAAPERTGAAGLRIAAVLWGLCLVAVMAAAAAGVDNSAQLWLAGTIVLFLVVTRNRCRQGSWRLFYVLCLAFISVRYFIWRTTETLTYYDFFSFLGALSLYGAELYSVFIGLLGVLVSIRPIDRPVVPLPKDESKLPTVDVFIPTYNETIDLLENTILAATLLDYPAAKLKVYVLDDGGTDQKCSDPDPEKAAAARERRAALQRLCTEAGAHYLTRAKNEHAKAGNVNAALKHTDGDLFLVLDADHVPTADFLQRTVGQFLRDDRLFLVQTPHYFINADPIEKNLGTFGEMPGESEMFFRVIQRGLDFWNAALFAGSAALIRRSAIEEIGGFSHDTITEDAETALELHARGYRSLYFSRPMISGLSPETFGGFIIQRMRWAQGMVQIFLLKRPLSRAGLSPWQRLCYLSNCAYWFFPFARVVFLLAPTLFLFFGLRIYDANAWEILVYTVPQYWAAMRLSGFLYGQVRWPFVSILYEFLQSMFSLAAVWNVLRNPRAPSFRVTPKGEHLERDFISPLAWPFYIVLGILVAGYVAAGVWWVSNATQQHVIYAALFWHTLNVAIMLAALGALAERRQRRTDPRIPVNLPAQLYYGDSMLPCRLLDVSGGGARIRVEGVETFAPGSKCRLIVDDPVLGRESQIQIVVRNRVRRDGAWIVGGQFAPASLAEKKVIVSLVFGDSERWVQHWANRKGQSIGVTRGLLVLVGLGLRHYDQHLAFVFGGLTRALRRAAAPLIDPWLAAGHRLALRMAEESMAVPATPRLAVALPAGTASVATPASLTPKEPVNSPCAPEKAMPLTPIAMDALDSTPAASEPAPAPQSPEVHPEPRRPIPETVERSQGARRRGGARKRHRRAWSLCLALVGCFLLPGTAVAQAASDGKPLPAEASYSMPLAKLMAEPGPITLRNDRDDEDVFVPLSERFTIDQASIRLSFVNSIALRGERSQMRVLANGGVVAQMPLDGAQPRVEVEAFVPPELLVPGFNRLRFETAQHYTIECEDPGAPELWTQIDTTRSSVSFRGRLQPMTPLLSEIDDYITPALGIPTRYRILTAGALTAEQVAVGGLLSQAAALRLNYRPGAFEHGVARALDETARVAQATHALSGLDQRGLAGSDSFLVGTREELAPFLGEATYDAVTGPYLGVYAQASDPRYLIFLVSGLTDAEVREAATVLTLLNFPFADEPASRVGLELAPGIATLDGRHRIEPGKSYTLHDLGFRTASLKGSNPQSVAVDFQLPPDFYVPEDANVRLSFNFAYGANLRGDSVLNIYLNDRFERAIPLNNPAGGILRDYDVYVPLRSFKPGRNVIEAEAVMVPSINEDCVTAQSGNLLLTLFDTSWLEFPDAAYYAEQPNLELFSATGFPYFGAAGNTSLPNAPMTFALSSLDDDAVAAVWTLVGKLAQVKGGPLLEARYALGVPHSDGHIIAVGAIDEIDERLLAGSALAGSSVSGGSGALDVPYPVTETTGRKAMLDRFLEQAALVFDNVSPPHRLPAQARVRQTALPQRYGMALAFQSPLHEKQLVTLFTATSNSRLKDRMEALVSPALWGQMHGDVVLWRGEEDPVFWQKAANTFFVGELALADFLRFHLSAQPLYWVGGVLLGLLLLAFVTRRLLIRIGRRLHGKHQIPED